VFALVVLFAINLMNFFDRQIIGGVGEGIRREWGLSDSALGLLGTVFTLLYAVVGLPLGRLSDRKERRKILAGGVFLWSLLTAASGVARNFSQLIVARLGVGVGEATCSPASTSLLGDLFPASQRARAVAIWMLGLPLGLGLAKIREGELSEGSRDIEVAASLDPNNALVRSYLGKAYFEEKRPQVTHGSRLIQAQEPDVGFLCNLERLMA